MGVTYAVVLDRDCSESSCANIATNRKVNHHIFQKDSDTFVEVARWGILFSATRFKGQKIPTM